MAVYVNGFEGAGTASLADIYEVDIPEAEVAPDPFAGLGPPLFVSYVRFRRVDGSEYRRAIYSWWISPCGYYQEFADGHTEWRYPDSHLVVLG